MEQNKNHNCHFKKKKKKEILNVICKSYESESGIHSVVSNSFGTPWTVTCQTPLSMEFSKQKYWSRLPFASAGNLPDPGIKPMSLRSPALAGRFFINHIHTHKHSIHSKFLSKFSPYC